MNQIFQNIEQVTGYTRNELCCKNKTHKVSKCLSLLAYECYCAGATIKEVAKIIGKCDNYVYELLRKYKKLQADPDFKEKAERLKEMRNN